LATSKRLQNAEKRYSRIGIEVVGVHPKIMSFHGTGSVGREMAEEKACLIISCQRNIFLFSYNE